MEILQHCRERIGNKRDILNFITFREASPEDDTALGEFLVSTFHSTGKKTINEPDMTEERLFELRNTRFRRENAYVRLVELGGSIVGSYTLSPPASKTNYSWEKNSSFLSTFALHPNFQGLGLGNILLLEAQFKSLKDNHMLMTLVVNRNARGLQRFYQRFGFMADENGDCLKSGYDLVGQKCQLSFIKTNELIKNL